MSNTTFTPNKLHGIYTVQTQQTIRDANPPTTPVFWPPSRTEGNHAIYMLCWFLLNKCFQAFAAMAHFAGADTLRSFLLCLLKSQHSDVSHQLECSLFGAMTDKCIRSLTAAKGFIEPQWPLVCSLMSACNHIVYITARIHKHWLKLQEEDKTPWDNQAQISGPGLINMQLNDVLLFYWLLHFLPLHNKKINK